MEKGHICFADGPAKKQYISGIEKKSLEGHSKVTENGFQSSAFKIDQHLTSKRDNSLPSFSSHLPPLPGEAWWEHWPNVVFLFPAQDVHSLYALLLSSESETVAPIKGQPTISPLKC